jgi:scyllo-inositol 2-dehydrogenase (NADP+)
MLNAKKHVLCEKSIASNHLELKTMLATAKENNVVLLEAMRPLFSPGLAAIRDNLHKLGAIRRVTFNYCQYSSRYDKFKAGTVENAFDPLLSNGALMDIGVYCVHMLVNLFGMPQKITAAGVGLKGSIDGEGTIIAQYDGMLAELIYSKIANSKNPSEIQGENGCMHIKMLSIPQDVEIIYNNCEEEVLSVEKQPDDMIYELREFIRLTSATQQAKDYNRCSEMALSFMDEARRQMNIVFPADN